MRAASGLSLPKRKAFSRMTGQYKLYNTIRDDFESKGMGWSVLHLPSGEEFLENVTQAFWALTPKVWSAPPPPPPSSLHTVV